MINNMIYNHSSLIHYILLTFVLVLSAFLFWQGSNGAFLLDDFPNLEMMAQVHDFESFFKYIFSGDSGPTGRPISLLSFAAFSEYWPDNPKPFIIGNILIHLINTGLVYVLMLKLLSLTKYNENKLLIALVTAFLWAVLPNHVSSVIYIIQRMTLLAATFSLISLIFMAQHFIVVSKDNKIRHKYWLFSLLSLGLAILSKENSATIVIVIYCMFYLFSDDKKSFTINTRIRQLFAFASLILFVYLLLLVKNPDAAYVDKGFSLGQRLLTQLSLMPNHLSNFVIPRSATNGLFTDHIRPVSTTSEITLSLLIGIFVLMFIFFSIWRLKNKQCFYSFWLLLFFIGHLIESTVIPLELYFEHRNYLPYLGFSVILVLALFELMQQKRVLALSILSLVVVANAYSLYLRASLWGKPFDSAMYWASINPYSVRAQLHSAILYAKIGQNEHAIYYMKRAYSAKPSPLIQLSTINFGCKSDVDTNDISISLDDFKTTDYAKENSLAMYESVALYQENKCDTYNGEQLLLMINNILDNPNYQSVTNQQQFKHMKAIVYLKLNQIDSAIDSFKQSLILKPNSNILISQTSLIASNGYCREALDYISEFTKIKINYRLRQRIKEYFYPSLDEVEDYKLQLNTICEEENSVDSSQ